MPVVVAAAQASSVAGDVRANVARQVAERAAERGVGLLVFPELSLTGYELELAKGCVVDAEGGQVRAPRDMAVRAGMTIAAGGPVAGRGGVVYAGAMAFAADGGVAIYTKLHVHESELAAFAVGNGGPLVEAGEARVVAAGAGNAEELIVAEKKNGAWGGAVSGQ